MCSEKRLQSFEQIAACLYLNVHVALIICEFAQRTRNMEQDLHYRLVPRLTLFAGGALRFAAGFALW